MSVGYARPMATPSVTLPPLLELELRALGVLKRVKPKAFAETKEPKREPVSQRLKNKGRRKDMRLRDIILDLIGVVSLFATGYLTLLMLYGLGY